MSEDTVGPIIEFVAQGLGKSPARNLWRNLVAVDLSFYKSYIAEEIRDEGIARGQAQGQAKAILLVLEERGLDVTDEIRERITGSDDVEILCTWLTRAVTATSAAEIFEAE